MPLKRGNNRKTALKAVADAEAYNNGKTEVSQELNEAKNFPNGTSLCETEPQVQELPILKATKRSSGRNKNAVSDLEAEASTTKKPVAKGRGKKKSNENKVIENEADIASAESLDVEIKTNEKDKPKPKGRGGGKKMETKTKNITKANETKQDSPSTGCETDGNSYKGAKTKLTENHKKVTSSRKKKQNVVLTKSVDLMETNEENEKEETASKNFLKNSKGSEKEVDVEIEPQKKKRTSKKAKVAETKDVQEKPLDEMKPAVKEKKPAKRGRATDKSVKAITEVPGTNGDTEEGIPKKRSRKAPSVEKEITKKSKKGRSKKSDNEEYAELQEKEDKSAANAETKEKTEEVEGQIILRQVVEEPRFNFKISSWNVAGLRSWVKKDGLKFLNYELPDIFCMQETKCTNDQLPEEVARIPGYHPYWLCMPGGYAGVAIYSKIMPINVEYGIGDKEFDDSGRIITAEFEKFFLINVYVPNSGRKLVNLERRMQWEKLFQQFVKKLDDRKPVIICGDMNVSHQEHDLANPKNNTRSAGFTKEERDKMTELLGLGYIDTFRHLYPERKGAYTYWTYMANARSRNVGWRLDYFIVSERFIKRVVDNCIRKEWMGSDHCPITLFLQL